MFLFENGRVECDPWRGSWLRVYRGEDEVESLRFDDEPDPTTHFIACLRGEAEPLVTAADAAREAPCTMRFV